MTTADTPAVRAPHAHTTIPTDQAPAPVSTLLHKLTPGWHHHVTTGHGHDERGGLSDTTDGDGKRHRVVTVVDVDSIALRSRHADGRTVRIVWAVQTGARTPTGRAKAPTFVLAWRGRHPGENAPAQLAATEIPAYMTATSPAAALAAVAALREDRKAAAARRATAKLAPVHELHPHAEPAEEVAA